MKYIVYKITNKLDSKVYIGVHATDNVNDGYMGSGVRIKNAIKKYGIDAFSKEILFEYDSAELALKAEKELVDEDFIHRSDTYNIVLGGGLPPSQKGKSFKTKKQSLKGDNRTEAQKLAAKNHSIKMKGKIQIRQKGLGGRAVKTPDGVFKTGVEACEHYKISSGTLHNRCKKKLYGFEFCDESKQ